MKYYLTLLLMISMASAHSKNNEHLIDYTLDSFHQAAAQADAKNYLSLLTADAIFLGTDATERWTKTQFTEFVIPYFDEGKGWSYTSTERNITIFKNGTVAFFDEILSNEKYGRCRGSGVLINTEHGWKISQYNLALLIPNDIALEVTDKIKAFEKKNNE